MTIELLKTIAADLLEIPDETSQALGKALGAMSAALEGFSARLDVIEAHLRGDTQ